MPLSTEQVTATAPEQRVRELLETLVEELELDAEVSVESSEDRIIGRIDGEDLGLLIGRHGQTLDGVQQLAYQAAFRGQSERRSVIVDAAGYRERRAELLKGEADRAVADALRFERPVSLDSMSSTERKFVHEYLRDKHDVETYSEGTEPDRHLVVAPIVSRDPA